MFSATLPVATASAFGSVAVSTTAGFGVGADFGSALGSAFGRGIGGVVVPDLAFAGSAAGAGSSGIGGRVTPLASGSSAVFGTKVFLPVGPTCPRESGAA